MTMLRAMIGRLWAYRVLLFNSGSLIGSTIVTAGLGFVYWWVAARLFPQGSVGTASALVSAMMLLGTLAQAGLGTMLIGEMPRRPGEVGTLIATSLVFTGGVAALLSLGFVVAAPLFTHEFDLLTASVVSLLAFMFGVILTTVTTVLDQILIGLLRGGLQFWRNIVLSAGKLLLLGGMGLLLAQANSGLDIYNTWTLGNGLSLALIVPAAWGAGMAWRGLRLRFGLLLELARKAASHHTINLSHTAPGLILPLIVTAQLGTEYTASFYAAWMFIYFLLFMPGALTMALYADSAVDPQTLARKTRFTMLLSMLVGAAACVVLFVLADWLLGLFGQTYADQAAWCLRLMALSVFPHAIKVHFVTIGLVQNRLGDIIVVVVFGSVLKLIAAALGSEVDALTGLAIGWGIAHVIEGIICLPRVYRTLRAPSAPALAPQPVG